MESYTNHVIAARQAYMLPTSPEHKLLESCMKLCELSYEENKLSIQTLLSKAGCPDLIQPVAAERDAILHSKRICAMDMCSDSDHHLAPALRATFDFLDLLQPSPLSASCLEDIGGPALAKMVAEYYSIAQLLPEVVQPPDACADDETNALALGFQLENASDTSSTGDEELDAVEGRVRCIKAKDNDTAVLLSTRYKCSVDEILVLNPEFSGTGFGGAGKSGRLMGGTPVKVIDRT